MLSATWDKATILFWHHINFGFLGNQAEKVNLLRMSVTHSKWQWLSSLTVPLSCGYCPRFGLHPQTLLFLCFVPSISSFQMPPLRVRWQPTPVFLPGESHGWWSLVGYSPRGRNELDMTKRLHFHFQTPGQLLLSHELNLLPILHNTNKTATQLLIF